MVGVSVSFEDPGDVVVVLFYECEDVVGGRGRYGAGGGVVVEDWVEDGCCKGTGVCDEVLECLRFGLEDRVDVWFLGSREGRVSGFFSESRDWIMLTRHGRVMQKGSCLRR